MWRLINIFSRTRIHARTVRRLPSMMNQEDPRNVSVSDTRDVFHILEIFFLLFRKPCNILSIIFNYYVFL